MTTTLNSQPTRFAEEGYCVFRNVFSPAEVAGLQQLLRDTGGAGTIDEPGYFAEPQCRDLRWQEICRHRRLLDCVEAVLGPNIVLFYSGMFTKEPGCLKTVSWHQDINFWGAIQGSDAVTVWLAFTDADRENGAMQVIPGTHRTRTEWPTVERKVGDVLGKRIALTPAEEATAVDIELKAGDLSIHDSYLLHGSGPNPSRRTRAGYTIRYCNPHTVKVDTNKHKVPVYLVRGQPGIGCEKFVDIRTQAQLS